MRLRPLAPFLVAEDDPNDMFLFTRLLKGCGATNPLHIALNGREAVELLERVEDPSGLVQRPGLVFLDIRMPHLNGLEVLEWIRSRRAFRHLPVVILSGADEPHEIARAYKLSAQCYLKKFPSAFVIANVLEAAARLPENAAPSIFDVPANLLRSVACEPAEYGSVLPNIQN